MNIERFSVRDVHLQECEPPENGNGAPVPTNQALSELVSLLEPADVTALATDLIFLRDHTERGLSAAGFQLLRALRFRWHAERAKVSWLRPQ